MGFANMSTFALIHALSLTCLHTVWHAIPTIFTFLMLFKSCIKENCTITQRLKFILVDTI